MRLKTEWGLLLPEVFTIEGSEQRFSVAVIERSSYDVGKERRTNEKRFYI